MTHIIKINFNWMCHHLPKYLMLAVLILSISSSFEGVINGYVLGQMTNIDLHRPSAITLFLSFVAIAYITTYLSAYLFLIVKQKCIRLLNQEVKTLFFKADFLSKEATRTDASDIINKVTNVSNQIQQQYFQPFFYLIQTLMTIISTTIVVLKTNWFLGIIYVLLSTLSLLPNHFGRKIMNTRTMKWSTANGHLVHIMKDIFQGKNEIKRFGFSSLFFKQFTSSLKHTEQRYLQMNQAQFTVQFLTWICAVISDLVPMGIGLFMAANHLFGVEIGTIVTLSLTADHIISGIREFASYQTQITSTASLREISLPLIQNQKTHHENTPIQETKTDQLNLQNVGLSRQGKVIFQGINLDLHDHQKVMITGPSGVGKSTLLELVSGQLKPDTGKITFDHRNVQSQDAILISQSAWIFNASVRENLTLYENFSDDILMAALQRVQLDRELGEKPLDCQLESGATNLSGGQAQRLAIARGLIRQKKLFLLDEITSSLDSENATQIRRFIYSLPIMVIEVAHQLDTGLAQNYHVQILNLTPTGLRPLHIQNLNE